jgi:transcriptional regulator GlxA family with amidase domain
VDPKPRIVGVVLFEQFELLDVCGPAEMLGLPKGRFQLQMIGPNAGPVKSAQGPKVTADQAFSAVTELDLVLVPGGIGTRKEVENERLLTWLRDIAADAEYVTSVCTGSAILARAGVLDGRRATSNKRSFEWVASQGPKVEWVKKARWIEDGRFWTSSGVSAGIDMALSLIDRLHGSELAETLAIGTEYDRHVDPGWDPFAELYDFTRE